MNIRTTEPAFRRDLQFADIERYVEFLERLQKIAKPGSSMHGVIPQWIARAQAAGDPEGNFYAH